MSNFTVFGSENGLDSFKNHKLATIDGAKAQTIKAFYTEIEKALELPDYFAHNLDSLDEMINDLEWIENENVAIVFRNSDQLLIAEKKVNKLVDILNLLDATAEDWKWLDEEDGYRKKNVVMLIEHSPRIIKILEREEIGFVQI
jgi:RNAse (barnase) inhibitor barstar